MAPPGSIVKGLKGWNINIPEKWVEVQKCHRITFPLWSTNGPRPLNILGGDGASNFHGSDSFSRVVCGLLSGEGGALRRSSVSCSRLSNWLHAWIQSNWRRRINNSRTCSSDSDSSSSSRSPVLGKKDKMESKSVDSDGVCFCPCRFLISCDDLSGFLVVTRQSLDKRLSYSGILFLVCTA